ncbi:hypothetical protein SOVF_197150 [Spinacia oleracea]|nr:hypothetical protein SOVF_197150 [Spinacia oleracea]
MSFDDRVAAVGIATQFQEQTNEVFKMVEEETKLAKTQVQVVKRCSFSSKCCEVEREDVASWCQYWPKSEDVDIRRYDL